MCEIAFRSNNFIVGLTNVHPLISTPTLWNYTVCGQYPGAVPSGATVILNCQNNLPPLRYLIVQFPITEHISFCELEVIAPGTWLSGGSIRALNRLSAVLGLKATTHSYSGSRNVHLLTFCSSGNYSDTVVRLKSSRISRCIVMSLMHYIIWFPFSLRCLLADSEAYSIIISDCCLDIVKLFSNRYSSYSFSLILYVSVNTQKKLWNRFSKFWF